jgi:small membrane protein
MTLVQPILITLLVCLTVVALLSLRSRLVPRMLVLVLLAAGIAFVANPQLANRAAHLVGVGRGADLLLYLFSLTSAYLFLLFFAQLRTLERKVTALTRNGALHAAKAPSEMA